MTTVTISLDDGRTLVFQHVSRIRNTSVQGPFLNGMDLFTRGAIQIDYDGGKQAFVEVSSVSSITTSIS